LATYLLLRMVDGVVSLHEDAVNPFARKMRRSRHRANILWSMPEPGNTFLESLMATELYSIGAYFCDEHPDLVDEVVARAEAIEVHGLEAYSAEAGSPVEETFETLLTGLAVRYYKAVAG
jgi:hypothetical protein